ncbi:doubled CXXCH domain-containing protein [Novosphingobium sp. CF614]|uniref:cytochrome c3 family protein n=1 Tax=Novosphingobium sp. CF614 TaxID=1884364 RepID=UPI0008EFBAE0|nr:cytochrome c3 family protein [Novosphingobium sp. CF614]SFG48847.1 doubled CXXCH domain-containing protein [Novosphingobium sp. CF614]
MHRFWILVCLVIAATAAPVAAQSIIERLITPGPLSGAHAKLESKCDTCHASFRKEAQGGKCLACHKPVAGDIASRTRFHGKYTPARTQDCKACHSEHKGRATGLIRLSRQGFDHGLTDFALTGAHARTTCAACHGPGNNYRGIPNACAGCHAKKDPHAGQLGRACQNCHSTAAWKPVTGFNHARTRFSLTGAHAQAACMTCHAGQRWKGLGTTCLSCHAKNDVHRGSRGPDCASCHRTTSWKSTTFDHASTGFPLLGAHAAASCAGCHGPGNVQKHPSRICATCHAKDDAHKGQNGADCAACHVPAGWRQVRFDHDVMTRFPLKGAHRLAACAGCHKQPPKVAKPPVTCFGCHAADDPHKGANGQDCARCHKETAWKIVDFNHGSMTRFPLIGAHAKARCETCHTAPLEKFKLSTECGSCHAKDDAHAGKLGSGCARCHDSISWQANVRFDHALSRFPLLGKHASAKCADCHIDKSFGTKGIECAACHQDDHHAGTLGSPAKCRDCHNSVDWKAWSFDHDRRTGFALTGQHKGLICSACHARPGDPAKAGTQCVDCHQRDDRHRGGFGTDCERCHVTSGFRDIVMNAAH